MNDSVHASQASPSVRRLLAATALLSIPIHSLAAQRGASDWSSQAVARLDSVAVATHFAGVFLLAALNGHGGRELSVRSYGQADLAEGKLVTDETRFITGSAAKAFTAVGVLRLVAQGRLALDGSIDHYLPDSLFPTVRAARVTVRRLLTHTAGMGDLVTSPAFRAAPDTLVALRQLLDIVRHEPDAGPTGAFRYGDSDYLLLGVIVEQVTGKAFDDALDELLLRPARMARSGFHLWPRPADLAHGYTARRLGTVSYSSTADSMAPVFANDAILPHVGVPGAVAYTTARDLMRFADALCSGRLLANAELHELWAGQVVTGQGTRNTANAEYGFGFFVGTDGGQRLINHGGTGPGIDVAFDIYPELGRVFIALSNRDPPAAQQLREVVRDAVSRLSPPRRAADYQTRPRHECELYN